MRTLNPGEVPPPFALPDENGTIHDLKDQRGRWTVVYFYPADDTPGCTTEACQFRDLHGDLQVEGATVWGISPQGAESHRKFVIRAQSLNQHIDIRLDVVDDQHAAVGQFFHLKLQTSR